MLRKRLFIVLAVGLLVGASSPASAADRCFTLPGVSGALNFVAKNLSIPRKNKCKPFSGASTLQGWLLSGTVCTTADGSALRMGFNGYPLLAAANPFTIGCNVPLPSLLGGTCQGSYSSASSTSDEVIEILTVIDIVTCDEDVP